MTWVPAALAPYTVISPEASEAWGVGHWRAIGANALTSAASATWPSDNLAVYFPFTLNLPMTVLKMWWYNGATLGADVDVGVFTDEGVKLGSSGATAQSGTSQIQIVDTADLTLGAGYYYLGLSLSVATATTMRVQQTAIYLLRMCGKFDEASAHPLPATATFATSTTDHIPFFGVAGVVTL